MKKTVNQDDPTVYHLFYADERGSSGADITFFEYPGAPRRAAPATGWCTASSSASPPRRRSTSGPKRTGGERRFGSVLLHDPEGLALELVVDDSGDEPLVAKHPEIPEEFALRGFAGVRAYAADVGRSAYLLFQLGFKPGWEARGDERGGFYVYDDPPAERGLLGRRHRAPRRVGLARRGARGLAREGDRRRAGSRRR